MQLLERLRRRLGDYALGVDHIYASLGCDADKANPPLSMTKLAIWCTPSPDLRFAKIKGCSPRILDASLSITCRSAPTNEAKSILFITRRSERVMPGPPLRGILSPAATSIT